MIDKLNLQLVSFSDLISHRLNTSANSDTDLFEIILFEKGNGTLLIDFQEYKISDNIVFFINPKTIRSISIAEFASCWVLTMNLKYLGLFSDNYQILFCPFTTLPYSPLSENDIRDIHLILTSIKDELSNNLIKRKEAIDALTKLLFIQIERIRAVPNNTSAHTNHLTLFYSLLEANFITDKDVFTYASKLNITTKQLNRLCLKYLNKNASRLIEERVNLEAMRLLYHSRLSVKEIALNLGFQDYSYFSRYFKRINKTTPMDFKSSMSEKHHQMDV